MRTAVPPVVRTIIRSAGDSPATKHQKTKEVTPAPSLDIGKQLRPPPTPTSPAAPAEQHDTTESLCLFNQFQLSEKPFPSFFCELSTNMISAFRRGGYLGVSRVTNYTK